MNNSKSTIWLFVACCMVPLVLAFIALKWQWAPSHTTNKGEFVEGEVHVSALEKRDGALWSIALNAPSQCGDVCLEQAKTLSALQTALGKNQANVEIFILGEGAEHAQFKQVSGVDGLKPAALYLVDNKGLVVLAYPFVGDEQENRLIQKGLLQDLKKLLSYARSS
ncbi:transmembrane cytochrome oxidase associated protein [Pseudoalteromonas fenneropenaei]|uniref:Transmembrane cytochrome oxidase associated protein n=1 Tax=Pseudoalteromonas fenneropenaei TaxID=1737459 RepID=A0ABV7CQP5_9GAMM